MTTPLNLPSLFEVLKLENEFETFMNKLEQIRNQTEKILGEMRHEDDDNDEEDAEGGVVNEEEESGGVGEDADHDE